MTRIGAAAKGFTPTSVQLLRSAQRAADEGFVGSPRWGRNGQGGHQVKARLYRTVFVVSIVAIFLEGLGAGFKWG